MRRFTPTVFVLVSVFFAPVSTYAQQPTGIQPGIRTSLAQVRFLDAPRVQSLRSQQTTVANRRPQKAKAAIGLGLLGTLVGGWLGAALEGNCRCDDPGLAGGMIGAPIGAVAGAMLGWHFGQ